MASELPQELVQHLEMLDNRTIEEAATARNALLADSLLAKGARA
jgi:hypothetical protein